MIMAVRSLRRPKGEGVEGMVVVFCMLICLFFGLVNQLDEISYGWGTAL